MPTFFRLLRGFIANSDGNVAIISAFAFLPLLVIAGGATDIARHEAYRVQLQDGVDRAVLAAASLTQTRTIETTVTDYLKGIAYIDQVDVSFTRSQTPNSREVTVTAQYPMQTAFLPLIGIETMGVVAAATAVERRSNIEISLMLDMSGSMREGTPSRISRLKPAAQNFIDAILTPDTSSYTSVSIVPYAGSVNPGAMVFDGLGGARRHSNSSCFEFAAADYASGMVNFNGRAQVPHFTYWNHNTNVNGMEWWWCPSEQTSISYLSNDAAALKQRIANYKMHDGTGSGIAMNWGLMLLDPSAQPLVQQGAAIGLIPPAFSKRPAPFKDGETLKFIVLMTDGAISEQWRPTDYFWPPEKAPVKPPSSPVSHPQTESTATTLARMNSVCKRAKDNGVVVFTIGFEAGATAANQMRACASSASHFYDVKGLDINTAFQSIASAIQKIRLTQ